MADGPGEISLDDLEEDGLSIDNEFDEQATELLELESELKSLRGAEVNLDEAYDSGSIVGVERTRISDVPPSYPVTFESPQALKLEVRLSADRTTTVYLDWPNQLTEETPLNRLLTTLDISPHSFSEILGRDIPLEQENNYYVAYIPSETETASPYWKYLVGGLLAVWMLIWMFSEQAPGGVIVLTWFLLPVATHFDRKYVSARSTWTPHKWGWTILSFVWMVNIPLGIVYLYKRYQADFPD